ncbi:hypothetical protein [Aquitalea sp. LB_tupeE]|uniref:hypothetical protein n=1 Tax=Aquitalea sp. LB_tupeE TaxID=2748078 RepID=UPI0015C16627|nr:hypothetical protein [Aquitalea sp. LB_tupeE]NWK79814.1 hypothetical protein [Aquitalea sp. LB_tupeE]
MLTLNQRHAAEFDGQAAAHRLLLLLNEHLHPAAYDSATDRTEAACTLLGAFAAVFGECLADATDAQQRYGAAQSTVLVARIIQNAPQLLASLNR